MNADLFLLTLVLVALFPVGSMLAQYRKEKRETVKTPHPSYQPLDIVIVDSTKYREMLLVEIEHNFRHAYKKKQLTLKRPPSRDETSEILYAFNFVYGGAVVEIALCGNKKEWISFAKYGYTRERMYEQTG